MAIGTALPVQQAARQVLRDVRADARSGRGLRAVGPRPASPASAKVIRLAQHAVPAPIAAGSHPYRQLPARKTDRSAVLAMGHSGLAASLGADPTTAAADSIQTHDQGDLPWIPRPMARGKKNLSHRYLQQSHAHGNH